MKTMNLLCPNCQKMLTVPDQSASQLMRCPLCTGTFTVPSLPGSATIAVVPATLPEILPPPISPPPASPPPPEDVFGVAAASVPPPPPRYEEPAKAAPSTERPKPTEAIASPPPPGSFEGGFTIALTPEILPWIAPAALALVGFLLFFSWTGTLAWGDKLEWYTVSGWGTGFGSNMSFLGTLHILLIVLALPLSVAMVVLPILGIKLPAAVEGVWPWRSIALAGLVGAATLLLLLQLVIGFGMQLKVEDLAQGRRLVELKDDDLAKMLKTTEHREYARAAIYHSTWLRLATLCHLIAMSGLVLQNWVQQRGNRALPRMDILW